MKGLQVPCTWC